MRKLLIFLLLGLIVTSECRRGGGSSSRGSSSRGSSSGSSWGWSSSPSRPSSSWSSPSPSRPSPSSWSSPSPSRPSSWSSPSPSSSWGSPSSYSNPSPSSYGWNIPSKPATNTFSNPSPPSYGWNIPSKPATNTFSSPSSSFGSRPSTGTSSSNIGWNIPGTSNTGTAQRPIGFNTGTSNTQQYPIGPPPAYPGLAHKPVTSHVSPPAYSPSYVRPPAYTPSYSPASYSPGRVSSPSYSSGHYGGSSYAYQPSYFSHSSYPAGNPTVINNHYYNNNGRSGLYGSGHSSLFGGGYGGSYYGNSYNSGWGHRRYNNNYNSYGYGGRRWGYNDERNWRYTTRPSYFHNRVPGMGMALPAAAVLGAATAFGVYSLLPLNVPPGKPLLSCNTTMLNQIDMMFNDKIYTCVNGTIAFACPLTAEEKFNLTGVAVPIVSTTTMLPIDSTTIISTTTAFLSTTQESVSVLSDTTTSVNNDTSTSAPDIDIRFLEDNSSTTEKPTVKNDTSPSANDTAVCRPEKLTCLHVMEKSKYNLNCFNHTVLATSNMICNGTFTRNNTGEFKNETRIVLRCYNGYLDPSKEVLIPTSVPATAAESTTKSSFQKFKDKAYGFLMWTIGRSDLVKDPIPTTTTPKPEFWEIPFLQANSSNQTILEEEDIETTTVVTTTTKRTLSVKQAIEQGLKNGMEAPLKFAEEVRRSKFCRNHYKLVKL